MSNDKNELSHEKLDKIAGGKPVTSASSSTTGGSRSSTSTSRPVKPVHHPILPSASSSSTARK